MGEGRAIEFIRYKEDGSGKLEVTEEAVAILKEIKGPIGCISVCGRARTGKSFILNQILGKSSGFKVGPTFKPCTHGIWIWSTPVPQTAADGSSYHLVLLDTEGIDSYEQTSAEGIQVFSLSVLLSSLFVYNQMGGIDEAALDRLALISELTKHIRVRARAQGDAEDARELGGFSPAFLWLLRDFYLDLNDQGRQVSPLEYLETALAPASGGGANVESKNQIRSSIKEVFPHRDCFVLVRPANEERHLRDLDTAPPEVMREEFTQGVQDLIALLFRRALPKAMGQEGQLTGRTLAGLAGAYVEAINAGAIPTISSAWQGVSESECRHAAASAEQHYLSAFNQDTEPEDGALAKEHQRVLESALAVYKELAVGGELTRRRHEGLLREACGARLEEVREKLQSKAAAEVDYQLYRGASYLSTVSRTATSWPQMETELQRVVDDYKTRTAGPTKWTKLVDFVQQQYSGAAQDCIQTVEGSVSALQSEVSTLKAELETAKVQAMMALSNPVATSKIANGHTHPQHPRSAGLLGCCTRPLG